MSGMKTDILWSPTDPNRFITTGAEILLYEVEEAKEGLQAKPSATPLSDYTRASVIASSSDHQYLKCVSWYPKADHPLLLAIGMPSGHVLLDSLDPGGTNDAELVGREFVPKQSRLCNCVAWNPIEETLLACGLEKARGEHSIFVWDISRSSFIPSSLEAVTNYERRPVFPPTLGDPSPATSKAVVVELGLSESTQSFHWFPSNPKILVCGTSNKTLKLYDIRDGSKHQDMTTTKAVYNVGVDPFFEHRLASSVDNCFVLWDLRNFEKPVVTLQKPKQIMKLRWAPTRSNLLAVLCKDSPAIGIYDIQSPTGNDEVEPAVVERNLQPFASNSMMSFAWHPFQENRMLAVSQGNQFKDFIICDRVTLNWSPSEIVWTCGRKILTCTESRDDFYSQLDDISVKMRRRAAQGYGLEMARVWMNAELAEDPNLNGVWMWLDLVKSSVSQSCGRRQIYKYEGVHSIVCGENGTATLSHSEPCPMAWVGMNFADSKIVKYVSEERTRALQLCGWATNFESNTLSRLLERLESDGQYTRGAAIAVFNLEIRRAIKILNRGAHSPSYKGSIDLGAIAMSLAGYTEDRSALWREVSAHFKAQLADPHLRAMFAFLVADDFDEILNESLVAVQDRMAFACLYLSDKKLAEFLDHLKKRMTETGNLDGLLLTGLSHDGLSLVQRYVDATGDVQTASLVILHVLPNRASEDARVLAWVQSYRNLLDTWRLWKARALFDVRWFDAGHPLGKPTQQVFVSCNFCRRPVSNFVQMRAPSHAARLAQPPKATLNHKKVTCCPGCRKPLPRCSLCLSHMGTGAGLHSQAEANPDRHKLTDFSNWLTWCQMCRHGGHSVHLIKWFQYNYECPVSGCACKCMSLDAVANVGFLKEGGHVHNDALNKTIFQ